MNDEEISESLLAERLSAHAIALDEDQIAKLAHYFALLRKWNSVFNLTGIRRAAELLDRHLIECLALRPHLSGARVGDIGTGAGLPGVPLAITERQRRFALIESRAKRAHFLRHVCGELALENADVAHCRAEDLPTGSAFDTVVARAVAPPAELLAIAGRLMAPGASLLILTSSERSETFEALAADYDFMEHGPIRLSARGSVIVKLIKKQAL